MIDRDQIQKLIPHRPPFLWIDRVEELDAGARASAVKFIDPAEPLLAGHFPGNAILPGVLIIEAAAETAAVMLAGEATTGGERLLAAVNYFKFLQPVRPGAELRIETRKLAAAGPLVRIEAVARVDGEVVAKGELTVYSS